MAEPAIPNPESPRGAFDPHHPPSTDLIDKCVHCGFCLATCPTYALWGEEMDSPRGRIYLMKLGLKEDGQVQLDPTFVNHMDNCLGCMACLTACPSGVQYDKLIEATRTQIERNYPRPTGDRMLRRMMFELFPRPERLRWLLGPMRICLLYTSGIGNPVVARWKISHRLLDGQRLPGERRLAHLQVGFLDQPGVRRHKVASI